jgi:hypothetical protein
MIHFTLRCDRDHEFDGWFRSGSDFDDQAKSRAIACPRCGSTAVAKGLMAPSVALPSEERGEKKPVAGGAPSAPEMVETLRRMRRYVEDNADYVGGKFAEEARRIHYNESEARGIYGEASLEDARELAEEGIEAFPLPRLPEDQN